MLRLFDGVRVAVGFGPAAVRGDGRRGERHAGGEREDQRGGDARPHLGDEA